MSFTKSRWIHYNEKVIIKKLRKSYAEDESHHKADTLSRGFLLRRFLQIRINKLAYAQTIDSDLRYARKIRTLCRRSAL